jgi:hypothetical protein
VIQRFMDIMRSACHNVPDWPSKLSKLKQLCGFFRCQGWRKVIIERGAGHYDNLPVLLKKFTAKFLKWRYETLFECFTQLAALRDLCQRVLYVHLRSFFLLSRMLACSTQLFRTVVTPSCGFSSPHSQCMSSLHWRKLGGGAYCALAMRKNDVQTLVRRSNAS